MEKRLFIYLLLILGFHLKINAQNCNADFMHIDNYLTITFIDSSFSNGTITSYSWDFGDNKSSTLSDPIHTYDTSGNYNVCLTISDTLRCTSTFCDSFDVFMPIPCFADYSYTVDSLNTVYFTNLTTSTATGGYSYSWDFGDGSFLDTNHHPSYTYANSGSYGVSLTAIGNGDTCSYYDTVYVNSCIAFFLHQIDTAEVTFSNYSASSKSSSYSWDFGDGNISNIKHPVHTYAKAGTYFINLTVFDSLSNCTSTYFDSLSIVFPQNCLAAFNFTVFGDSVDIQNTASNFTHLLYEFGDGDSSTALNLVHTYASNGAYQLCQTVYDSISLCTNTICQTVVINVAPPCSAGFSHTINQDTIKILSSASNFSNILYDFGDGDTTSQLNPTHIYQNSGRYIISQTVNSGNTVGACIDVFYDTVNISVPPPCVSDFSFITNDKQLTIFNRAINYTSIRYDFGDGTSSTQASPIHTYLDSGSYTVCQTIMNINTGCSDVFCDTVVIVELPQCSAGFITSVSNDTVNFQSTAINFTNIVYQFGDGDSSTLLNPTHIYQNSQLYTVCQTVSDSLTGCISTFCDSFSIRVPAPCEAGFTYSMVGDSVLFQSTASNHSGIFYEFGDGDTSGLENPYHHYSQSGSYEVTQYAFNSLRNCVDTLVDTINVSISTSCFATYSVAIDTSKRQLLYLINFSSNHPNHEYSWTFGDGNTGTGRTPSNTYTAYGKYEICLTVSDSILQCTSTFCDSVGLDSNNNVLKSSGYRLQIIDGRPIGIEENKLENQLKVFPNPTNGLLQIKFSGNTNQLNYQIIDVSGKLLKEETFRTEKQIDLSHLKNGLYFLRFTDQNEVVVKRIIKQ